jgi:hypothetical protein
MRRSMGLLSVLAVAAAGCGGSGGGGPAPAPKLLAGFARYDASGVSFAHPSAWTFEKDKSGLIDFYGARGTGGFPPQVGIGIQAARNSLADTVRLHKGMQKVVYLKYRVTGEHNVTLAGATGARRIDAEYELKQPGKPAAMVREVNLLVLTSDKRQLDFFVRAPAADYGAQPMDAILGSLHIG